MRLPRVRFTMRWLMVATAVVAANLAYLRWYGVPGTPVGTRLIVPILQAGLLCAASGPEARRRFGMGFVAFGTAALVGWFCAMSRFPRAADECFRAAMNAALGRFPLAGHNRIMISEPSHQALAEVLVTMPQLVMAVAGGILLLVSRPTTANGPADVEATERAIRSRSGDRAPGA